jgi:hypothetical protein
MNTIKYLSEWENYRNSCFLFNSDFLYQTEKSDNNNDNNNNSLQLNYDHKFVMMGKFTVSDYKINREFSFEPKYVDSTIDYKKIQITENNKFNELDLFDYELIIIRGNKKDKKWNDDEKYVFSCKWFADEKYNEIKTQEFWNRKNSDYQIALLIIKTFEGEVYKRYYYYY